MGQEKRNSVPVATPKDIIADRYLFQRTNCDKCVYSYGYGCPGPANSFPVNCPSEYQYKRDPPDGGFYG